MRVEHIFFLFLVSGFAVSTIAFGGYVEGFVYEDRHQTGQRDYGDPGIANVMVSNQYDVVLTDENGYYRLPMGDEGIVFFSKPADYRYVLDDEFLPQFYYVHRPEGSPQLEYPGISPTGSLPDSVDFGLIRTERRNEFRAIVFGDPQPRNDRELDYFRKAIISEMAGLGTDMVIVLGDLMFDDLSLFPRYNRIMSALRQPVINILGNHDINFDAKDNRYSRETFISLYGPSYYSFSEGGAHFIVLDNIDYKGRDGDGIPRYVGNLLADQLKWIERNLKHVGEDKLIVLLGHIPLFEPARDSNPALRTDDRTELMAMLENYDNVLFLGAHVHTMSHSFLGEDFGRFNSKPLHQILAATASGSWWLGPKDVYGIPAAVQRDGTPNGYHVFSFSGNSYTERFKAAGRSPEYQMRFEKPGGVIATGDTKGTEVRVNVFNGSERSVVRMRVAEGEWIDMKRMDLSTSTFFERLRDNEIMPERMRPVPTPHVWRAELPVELPRGGHRLEAWTRDAYGQEFSAYKVIEVVD